jgi:hypothetical protein
MALLDCKDFPIPKDDTLREIETERAQIGWQHNNAGAVTAFAFLYSDKTVYLGTST